MKETLEDFMKQLHHNHTSFEELAHWYHDLEKECSVCGGTGTEYCPVERGLVDCHICG